MDEMVDKQRRYSQETISDLDILCGSGSLTARHPGNIKFRKILAKYLGQYVKARSKSDKMSVSRIILAEILEIGGRFLKRDSTTKRNSWYVAEINVGKDKISHALRLMKKHQREDDEQPQKQRDDLMARSSSCSPLQHNVQPMIPKQHSREQHATIGGKVSTNNPHHELLILPHRAAVGNLVRYYRQQELFGLSDPLGSFELPLSEALGHHRDEASGQIVALGSESGSSMSQVVLEHQSGSHQQPLLLRRESASISGTYDQGKSHIPWNFNKTIAAFAATTTTSIHMPPSRLPPPHYLLDQSQHVGFISSLPNGDDYRYASESHDHDNDLNVRGSSKLGSNTDLFDRRCQQRRQQLEQRGTNVSRQPGITCSSAKNSRPTLAHGVNNLFATTSNELSCTPCFRDDSKRKWRAPPSPCFRQLQEEQKGYNSGSEYASDDTLEWFIASINDDFSEDTTQTFNDRSRPCNRNHCRGGTDDSNSSSWKLSQTMLDQSMFGDHGHNDGQRGESNFHRRKVKKLS